MQENKLVTVGIDDDDDDTKAVTISGIRLGAGHRASDDYAGTDPFLEEAKDIRKNLDGLSPDTKRRMTNDIKKFHRGIGEAGSKKEDYDAISGYDILQVVQPPYNLDYLAKLYEVSSPHYAAVGAKTSNIVGLGFDLIESPVTKRKLEEITEKDAITKFRKKLSRAKDELLDRIDLMNEEDAFLETLRKIWIDYESTGNAYLEIGRTNRGDIGFVGHVQATSLRVRRKRDGFVQIMADKAVFFRHFGQDTVDPIGDDKRPNELIHIKKYVPSGSYYGVPDIIPAKNAVAGMEFAARYNLDYFENKAVPRHVIILKGAALSRAAEQSVLEFFETGLKGRNHRSMYIPLPGDTADEKVTFEIKPIEAGIQDASFTTLKKSAINEILMAHRVPITKVSVEGVSNAASRDADKTFKEIVCNPEQKILEKKLNKVTGELTDIFVIKLNELTLTDADTLSKIRERQLRNGERTPNELRAEDGFPGIEGGDKTITLTTQQSADRKATAEQSRARDAERAANVADSGDGARNPQGEGRQQA